MNNKAGGLLLLAIMFGSIAAIPAFAATNSTSTNSTSTNSTAATSQSATTPATSQGTGTAPVTNTTRVMPTPPANLPPPSYMINAPNGTTGAPSTGQLAVTVSTDKQSYNDGDKVTISGTTRDYMSDTPLTLIVRNPVGNVVKVDQVQVNTDKTYSTTLTATGLLWQAAGTYTISVQYGSPDRSAKTSFSFTGSSVSSGPSTIQVDGTSYSISYTITNGKVLDIKANPQSKSLVVTIQTTGDGLLTITMPRAVIDAKKSDGTDDQFIVLNDGQQNGQANETQNTGTQRTLAIPFKNGTQQIEVVGTFVIPEFGPVAALVLTVAIISIVAISRKTGLRFGQRY